MKVWKGLGALFMNKVKWTITEGVKQRPSKWWRERLEESKWDEERGEARATFQHRTRSPRSVTGHSCLCSEGVSWEEPGASSKQACYLWCFPALLTSAQSVWSLQTLSKSEFQSDDRQHSRSYSSCSASVPILRTGSPISSHIWGQTCIKTSI